MEDFSESSEKQNCHVFPNAFTRDTDPFQEYDDTELKFVRINPTHLQEVASKNGWTLSPDQAENGVVIVGPEAQYHWQMVGEALKTNDREDIRDSHSYVDSGFLMKWPGENEVHIRGGSAELKAADGKIFADITVEKQEEIHETTAQMLNGIFAEENEEPKFIFKVMHSKR